MGDEQRSLGRSNERARHSAPYDKRQQRTSHSRGDQQPPRHSIGRATAMQSDRSAERSPSSSYDQRHQSRSLSRDVGHQQSQRSSHDLGHQQSQRSSHDLGHQQSRSSSRDVGHQQSQRSSHHVGHQQTQRSSHDLGHQQSRSLSRDVGHQQSQRSNHDLGHQQSRSSIRDVGHQQSQRSSHDVGHHQSQRSSHDVGHQQTQRSSHGVGHQQSQRSSHDLGHQQSRSSSRDAGHQQYQRTSHDVGHQQSQRSSHDLGHRQSQHSSHESPRHGIGRSSIIKRSISAQGPPPIQVPGRALAQVKPDQPSTPDQRERSMDPRRDVSSVERGMNPKRRNVEQNLSEDKSMISMPTNQLIHKSEAIGGFGDSGSSPSGDSASLLQNRAIRERPINPELLNTRPKSCVSKKAHDGTPIKLQANYYKVISSTDWCLYKYRVDFEPEEEKIVTRKGLLKVHGPTIGQYIYDGSVMYTTQSLNQPLTLRSTRKSDGSVVTITIRFVGDIMKGDEHYLQFYNILMRKCLQHLQLQLVGRNFYDARNKAEVPQFKLELWPGYVNSIRQYENDILMCSEITYKVMRQQTVLDILHECLNRYGMSNYQARFSAEVIGLTVLTDYNNNTYRIEDVAYDVSPSSTFTCKNVDVTYKDYYLNKYQINIRDPRQPMLLSRSKARDRRAGLQELVYLVPELCRTTGLTDDMRADHRMMRELANHTRINPCNRIDRLMKFNRRLHSEPKVVEEISQWNLKLDNKLVDIPARQLNPEVIIFGKDRISAGINADWTKDIRNHKMLVSAKLQDWHIIVRNSCASKANEFVETMRSSVSQMQFEIAKPTIYRLNNDDTRSYIAAIEEIMSRNNPQMIMCVVMNNRADRYAAIKKKCCIDRPVPSQCILAKNLSGRGNQSIATKVAVQMNCKLGGCPWTVNMKSKTLMVVGFDVCHDSNNRSNSYGLRQHSVTDSPKGGGVNEAGVFVLRGRQEGNRRARRTTTTTTTTTSTTAPSISTPSTRKLAATTLTSVATRDVVRPAALLAASGDQAWSSSSSPSSSPPSSNYPSLMLLSPSQNPPIEIVIKPQSKVILPCELEGNYTRILQPLARGYRTRPAKWLHGGKLVDMITIDTRTEMSGTGHRYIGDSSTAALHIDSVRLEDDGIWSCTLEDNQGENLTGKPVKLVVLDAPHGTYLLIDGRRLDPGNQFVPVKEGSDLTLECAAEGGNPAPILTWGMILSQTTLDGPEQPPDNLTVLPFTQKGHSGAHLKVLRGHHNATITCIARHITLPIPMNASILLDVQYTPSFVITRLPGFGIPIVEGMSVSVKCEVDSNPSSAPIWRRDDNPPPVEQSEGGWLNFTKITRAESGWYKCFTRHTLGSFSSIGYFLNVRYNPDMETEAEALNGEAMDSRKMEVQIGGAVTLECDGGCWGHGPGMDPIGGPGPLILSRVVYQDAGEYRCVAPDGKMQGAWRAQLPYHVKVTGQPMVHPLTQTITANEGQTLEIIVEFCAMPAYTRVIWLSWERVYVPGSELSSDGVLAAPILNGQTEACYRSTLRFERVQWSHAGEWMLLVRSPEGTAVATVLLNVARASGYSNADFRSASLVNLVLSLGLFALYRQLVETTASH